MFGRHEPALHLDHGHFRGALGMLEPRRLAAMASPRGASVAVFRPPKARSSLAGGPSAGGRAYSWTVMRTPRTGSAGRSPAPVGVPTPGR